jgi:hypothetical protein
MACLARAGKRRLGKADLNQMGRSIGAMKMAECASLFRATPSVL